MVRPSSASARLIDALAADMVGPELLTARPTSPTGSMPASGTATGRRSPVLRADGHDELAEVARSLAGHEERPGTMNEDPLTGANKGDTNTDVG